MRCRLFTNVRQQHGLKIHADDQHAFSRLYFDDMVTPLGSDLVWMKFIFPMRFLKEDDVVLVGQLFEVFLFQFDGDMRRSNGPEKPSRIHYTQRRVLQE